jgi:hypothetical protein
MLFVLVTDFLLAGGSAATNNCRVVVATNEPVESIY